MSFFQIQLILFAAAAAGGMSVFLISINQIKILKLFLSFSGAYILAISTLHLFPEVYEKGGEMVGIYILIGFILQVIFEQFSRGIEHGHMHVHNHAGLPFWIMFSLCLHAFLEGMPLGTTSRDVHSSNTLLMGITFHKIPEAFALISVLSGHLLKKRTIILFLFVFSIMSPLGVWFSHLFENSAWGGIFGSEKILALVLGLLLHISTTILFESSDNHRFGLLRIVAIVIGLGIGFITVQH